MAERIWPEINSRVNYPIKSALMSIEESGIICIDDPLHKFSVSHCTTRVASAGAETAIAAWNDQSIPSELKWNMQLLTKCTYNMYIVWTFLMQTRASLMS